MLFRSSISAFCNAGFDLMGTTDAQYVSLTGYGSNIFINIIVILLIVIGGIGFVTWEDICKNKFHLKKYRMQSKLILLTSFVLIVIPAIIFYFNDFAGESRGNGILNAVFQSVTTRTAGFNTVDLTTMKGASIMLMIMLMLVGGSPGSTAGGMKTTTLAVLLANMMATFRRKKNANFFNRRIANETVKNAATIAMLYIMLFVTGGFQIGRAHV